ncbi:ImmA/IrrE family metallo-endopeptidase [uncultured Fenollaria sp.]|uniref:ImmA/IrrE family metallo-endopeptidase n=1 Tax=uncultured Fenollaria sp. TaxID=1686315 RepID=UPI0026014A0E|nr:ImmA/IrrE family metallo-endopeptidase [uncultured Fenollaria sp.]
MDKLKMDKLKTYGDIYDEEFLKKFGDYRKYVEKAELDKEFEVDVRKIADLCKIEVIEEELDVSGSCELFHSAANDESSEYSTNEETRVIRINMYEPLVRQRFTIAHEIGHILLGHGGISYRDTSYTIYKDLIERMNEVSANTFAAELLMPERLLRKALENTMSELNYDKTQKFSDSDIDYLAENTAKKMMVSVESFKYRLKNLNIFR